MEKNKIMRVDGVIGGYIAYNGDVFKEPAFSSLVTRLKRDSRDHINHGIRYIFKPRHMIGVAAPLNEISTVGWKCGKCTNGK